MPAGALWACRFHPSEFIHVLIRFVFNYHSGFCVENQQDGRLVQERT